jgi:hypothetical protein
MQAELRNIERAVTTGTRDAGRGLNSELRRQVASAGLVSGSPTVGATSTTRTRSSTPRAWCTQKAPQIIRAFDGGAVIRSRRGLFRAIPTENAPKKGTDGRRITPSSFPEHRFGPLRFVPQSSGPSLLVVDSLRASSAARPGSCEASDAQPIAPEHGAMV